MSPTTDIVPEHLMYNIFRQIEEIDRVCYSKNEEKLFGNISITMPKLLPAELGFIRVTSWLYVLYFELGKISIDYFNSLIKVYNSSLDECINHINTIHNLRTYLQHNLDPGKSRNKAIQKHCETWLSVNCNTAIPSTEEQWLKCLNALLREATEYLNALMYCIRSIEQDESSEEIFSDWLNRRNKYHPPHEFDKLISIVANDMGKDYLDVVRFRKKYYSEWSEHFMNCKADYIFELEARKLVESVLISNTPPILPITGKDIINEFDIPPGPIIGELLETAKEIYSNQQCNTKELLNKLREKIQNDKK